MIRALLAALIWAAFSIPAHAEMPRRDAAALLDASVVEMRLGTRPVCTAAKIGPKEYLTARHCTRGLSDRYEVKHHSIYQFPDAVRLGLAKRHDWAVLSVPVERSEIASLPLGCEEDIYVGMPVAYMGFPTPVKRAFGVGYVSSVGKTDARQSNADFTVDVQASHGASGAPIVSLDTGRVIGVLIEGVAGGAGFFLVGVQAVRDTPLCEGGQQR